MWLHGATQPPPTVAAAFASALANSPSLPLARLRARCLLPYTRCSPSPQLSEPMTTAQTPRADATLPPTPEPPSEVDTTAEPTPPPERHRCSSNVAARATARAAAATQV